jgi:hypothetical protein
MCLVEMGINTPSEYGRLVNVCKPAGGWSWDNECVACEAMV